MRSLRGRLLLGMVAGMAFLLAVFAFTVYTGIRRTILEELDSSLAVMAQTLLNSVEHRNDRIRLDLNEAELPELVQASRPYYFQLHLGDGTELGRSRSLEGGRLLAEFHGQAEKPDFQSITLPTGRPGRAIGIEFHPPLDTRPRIRQRAATNPALRPAANQPARAAASQPAKATSQPTKTHPGVHKTKTDPGEGRKAKTDPGEGRKAETAKKRAATRPTNVILVAALDSGDLEDQLAWLRWMLVGVGGATVLLSLAVASLVVRQGLRPVNRLAGNISAIDEDDLALRLPIENLPRELAPVVDRLNDLLKRLEEAFRREKGFTADVAHELRTPLAGMRSTIEVTLSRARKSEDYCEALGDCLAIAARMQAMVDSLLTLTRMETGQMSLRPRELNLDEVILECWHSLAEKARTRGLAFEDRVPGDLAWVADRSSLRLILGNLLDNAVEYTDAGGRIWVESAPRNGELEIRVSNTGCQLTEQQVERVFERMWRGDASRTGAGEHAGLGLALVRRATRSLGGSAAAEVRDGVFTITLVLPAAQVPDRPAEGDGADGSDGTDAADGVEEPGVSRPDGEGRGIPAQF